MVSFTRTNVSLDSQAAAINQFKDHVTTLRKQEAKLQEAKGGAAPWQKPAIQSITPFLDELEGYTFAIIEHSMARPSTISPSTRTISKPTPTTPRIWRP
jgi:hypothetical protein